MPALAASIDDVAGADQIDVVAEPAGQLVGAAPPLSTSLPAPPAMTLASALPVSVWPVAEVPVSFSTLAPSV